MGMKYSVGDRVIVTGRCGRNLSNEAGTVVGYKHGDPIIEFDKNIHGHDGGGKGKKGHCWACNDELYTIRFELEPFVKIKRKYNKTIAIDHAGNKGVAKCHPDDEYSFHTGARIAFERLMGNDAYPAEDDGINDRVGFKNSEPAAMMSEIKNGGTVDIKEDDMVLSETERRILQNAKEINNFDAYAISDEIERRILQNANQLDKIDIHKDICDEIHSTYRAKNADYGDSFAKVREKFPNSILIRLNDKLNRLEQLYENGDQQVQDESVRDTLIDLAGYCILELLEIEIDSRKSK